MKTIWKFPFEITGVQTIKMPKNAIILTAQVQQHMRGGDIPTLWAEVDDQQPKEDRIIEVIGTGNPVETKEGLTRAYIATIQLNGFVWHVYERNKA